MEDPAPYAIVEQVADFGMTPEEAVFDAERAWIDRTEVRANLLKASRAGTSVLGAVAGLFVASVVILFFILLVLALMVA